jgi:MFS family permease
MKVETFNLQLSSFNFFLYLCTMEKKERLWNANYCKVMTGNFMLFFAFYVLTPLLPLYLSEHFGATKDMIGLVLSGYTVTALIFRPFSGFMVDTFSRKTVLMFCYGAFAIFFAGYLAAGTLLMFTILRTLHGGPFGALTVANSTVAIDVLPSSRRTEGIGFYGLSNNLSMAIAPSVGIWLYHATHSFELLFWVALVVAFTGWLVDSTVSHVGFSEELRVKSEESPADYMQSNGNSNWLSPSGRRAKPSSLFTLNSSLKHSSFERFPKLSWDRFFLLRGWLIGLNMVAFGFCFGVLSNYLAIYGKETLGITSGTGTYFMLCSIGLMLSRIQGRKGLSRGLLTHNAGGGMCISLVGYTLFILMPTLANYFPTIDPQVLIMLGYYGSAILIGLGNGHMWPAFQNMTICVGTNRQRGTANSTILVSWDVGMGLGVLLGGIIAEHLGYSASFWTVAFVNAVGVAMFFLWTRSFFLKRNLNESVR